MPSPKRIRYAHYDFRVFPFMEIEVEEHNDCVGSTKDNLSTKYDLDT